MNVESHDTFSPPLPKTNHTIYSFLYGMDFLYKMLNYMII